MVLEIYTDASMRTFPNGRTFGCSGAIAPHVNQSCYVINPDSTNNRSELVAVYLGVQMANHIKTQHPEYDEIHLYSDSKFSIAGLTKWIYSWEKTMDTNGIMYGSNKEPVKNQDLFVMILSYLAINKLKIHFHHQAGHVRYTSIKMLKKANQTFYGSNGYYLTPEDIFKISYYNGIVDATSRAKLDSINPNEFMVTNTDNNNMARYVLPKNFRNYIS